MGREGRGEWEGSSIWSTTTSHANAVEIAVGKKNNNKEETPFMAGYMLWIHIVLAKTPLRVPISTVPLAEMREWGTITKG